MNTTGIATLTVGGLRGLAQSQSLRFSSPTGADGSGMTILVGSNNSGKSSLIEALRYVLPFFRLPSFTQGKRNVPFGDKVSIEVNCFDGRARGIESFGAAGSETRWMTDKQDEIELLIIPLRRTFSAFFSDPMGGYTRSEWARNENPPPLKNPVLDRFTGRLFALNRDADLMKKFNVLFDQVVPSAPRWSIDQNDTGQYFLKFRSTATGDSASHSSDGIGEGILSLIFIIDALYDSPVGSTIVIDEPELSLHPQFQRRLFKLLMKESATKQIVYATHSPYFISPEALSNGAQLARVFKTPDGTQVRQSSPKAISDFAALARDLNNPHVLGQVAMETFFAEDGIVLTEGQEDVIFLQDVLNQLGVSINGEFYGWGVGGAEKMRRIARVLEDLGYERVAGILDNDKPAELVRLKAEFPDYFFGHIPADDVRQKDERTIAPKYGLVDKARKLRPELEVETAALFDEVRSYLDSTRGPSALARSFRRCWVCESPCRSGGTSGAPCECSK